jgi:predicted Zn-dependent peptidase
MRATRVSLASLVAILLASLLPGSRAHSAASTPEIPFERYKLANGLEVILHPDTSVPTVHVEVWYKVGSKDEEPGRTGFAHLFEHMMFQGTKHIPEDAFFKYLAEAGASNRNGSTGNDLTNYYETLPSNQLELGLWLESSRMGFLLERPSFQKTFENQRDVVKNERRQRIENAPMGALWRVRSEAMYPPNHPYHHEVIGSMADLDAATETDIRNFFTRYYAPNNAMLLVAGDIDVAKAKGLIEKYFGPIPAGPAIVRRPFPPTGLPAERRIPMEAKVNLPTQTISYHTVAGFQPCDAEMDLVGEILGGGKTSRLYKRLVYDLKIAQSVRAGNNGQLHAGEFSISFTPLAGRTLAEIEKVVDEEVEKIRTQPVDARELERVKNQTRAGFFRSLEPLQGRGSRLLAYSLYTGDPGYIGKDLARYQSADAAGLKACAAKHLKKNARLVITVDPNPQAPIMGRVKP